MAGGKKEPIVVAQIMGKMNGGGVEAVIMNYYRHIDRSKIQFDFICDEDSTNIPREEIEKLGGHVIICPPYQKLFKYMKFLTKLFREKKYYIVHSNINTLSVFPLRAAKKAGVPVRIAHSHNTSNPKEFKRNLIKNILRKFSKKYATDFFACSELAGRYQFGNKAFNAGLVKIVPNAIDVEKFKFDPEARKRIRKELGIKEDDFVIGHIGRFVEQKNHSFLVDVFAEVREEKENAKLVLVGQGPLEEKIKNKVKRLGLEKEVFFLGQRSDVEKIYSVFDIFCLPSLYEGLPVVGIEAQINGVTSIFSQNISKEILISQNSIRDTITARLLTECSIERTEGYDDSLYSIKKCSRNLETFYEEANNRLIIITTGLLPVPATSGGAVEALTERIIEKYEQENIHIVVTSIFDEKAKKKAGTYKNISFIFTKTPIIIVLMDKLINFVAVKIFKVKKMTTYSHPLQRLHYINLVSKELRKNDYAKILIENSPSLYLALKWRKNYVKYAGRYYCHLHNLIEKDYGCKKIIANTKNIICVSEYVAKDAKEKIGISGARLMVVKNCIDTQKYLEPISLRRKERIRNKYGIAIDDKVIIFAGRLTEEKGIRELLLSLQDIKEEKLKLVIVGGYFFDSAIKNNYLNEIKSITDAMSGKVIFTGYVEYEKMNEVYAMADIAVLPSIWQEPAGQTMIEALTSGLPLISTRSGGIPEYVPKKGAILVDNDERIVEHLKKEIMAWINNDDKYDSIKSHVRDCVDVYAIKRYQEEMLMVLGGKNE